MVTFPRIADDHGGFTQHLAAGDIAASRSIARRLGLKPGSHVTLPTPSGPRAFTVGALFDDWAFQGTFAIDLESYRAIWGDYQVYRYAIVPSPDTSLHDLEVRLETAVT